LCQEPAPARPVRIPPCGIGGGKPRMEGTDTMTQPERKICRRVVCGALSLLFMACTGVPRGLKPVTGFEADRYLGKWYEIARLDHSFERGLSRVTADYSAAEGGGIVVVNRGYDEKGNACKRVRGRAYFIGGRDVGSLKVSFFGPFYAGYHVIALDREGYRYAMVSGATRSYLWILARTPRLSPAIVDDLTAKAKRWGFATEKLIFVDQTPAPACD
jgi:apolipoprotein D and lipocalin family protein